jgi:hypothetical protein
MKAEELRALLAVLTEAAPKLREAGVATVEHGTLKVTLAPLPTTVVVQQKSPVPEHERALENLVALSKAKGAASR